MNQPSDTFAHTTRRLTSDLKRVRDWAGGDPARQAQVADALVALNAHRVAGHAWADAASGVQEAVVLASKVLALNGPVGPYTPPGDAVRSISALVHLAAVASAAGLHAQAEQALQAAFGLRDQLRHLDVGAQLEGQVVASAMVAWSRAALAAGAVAEANARADAALAAGVERGFVAVDVDRSAAEARWAAGRMEAAIEHLLRAVEGYEAEALEALSRPSQLPTPMARRLSEPLFGLYTQAADALVAFGAQSAGLQLRRRLVDLLGGLEKHLADDNRLLSVALADLADDLRAAGRGPEADDVAELAGELAGENGLVLERRPRVEAGEWTSWAPLAETEGLLRSIDERPAAPPEPQGRLAALREVAEREERQRRSAAQADLERRAGLEAAENQRRAERQRRAEAEAERRRAEEAEARRQAAEQEAAQAEAERLERQRLRAERKAEHERRVAQQQAEAEAALRARVQSETAEERAEREELEQLAAELAALEDAERAESQREAERLEAERVAAEQAERDRVNAERAESQREAEQERLADEAERAEAERLAAEQAERDRVNAERLAAEQAERDRVNAEQERWASEEAERAAAEQAERDRVAAAELAEAERLAAERAEVQRSAAEEAERVAAEQAERDRVAAAERAEAERLAAEQAERDRRAAEQAEAARQEAERAAAEQAEAARLETERAAAEQAERDRLAAEQAEAESVAAEPEAPVTESPAAEPLAQARAILEQAQASGSKREVREAAEVVVAELQSRYDADPEAYLDDLLAALDQLGTARWQAGDWWGSREPGKQAKALRKQHGR